LYRWRREETEARFFAVTRRKEGVLGLLIFLFQGCLRLKAVIREFVHIIITFTGLALEWFCIIGAFQLIGRVSLNDTLPIPMLTVPTLRKILAFPKALAGLPRGTRRELGGCGQRRSGVSRACDSRRGALARVSRRRSGELAEGGAAHTGTGEWYVAFALSRILEANDRAPVLRN
jgi:hypothetical protein